MVVELAFFGTMSVTVAFGATIFRWSLLVVSFFAFVRLWSVVVLLGNLALVGLLGYRGVAIPVLVW